MNAEQREYAEAVRNCGDHLLTIINDILDFSKIEAGKLALEIIDFDLRHAVEDSLDLFGERASSKQLNLACLFHADVPSALRGDPGRVRQVLTNLVGNAIKFTDKGDVIVQVRLESQEPGAAVIRFEVTDTGIGISAEQQARLFQAFSQADGSTTRKYGGTGLGLAISKRLVEMMGGTVSVTSQLGSGSSFSFTARFELQPAQISAVPQEIASLQGVSVLIVDDKAINRRILESVAKKWGMHAAVFGDGAAALASLRERTASGAPYDLAILDFDMAGLDGLQLAQAMLTTSAPVPPRIVLLTSVGRRGDAKVAKETGVSAYLTKPVRARELQDRITQVLARLAAWREQTAAEMDESSPSDRPTVPPRSESAPPTADAGEPAVEAPRKESVPTSSTERPEQAQSPPQIDWAGALRQVDGDPGLLQTIASAFLAEAPPYLDSIDGAIEAGQGRLLPKAFVIQAPLGAVDQNQLRRWPARLQQTFGGPQHRQGTDGVAHQMHRRAVRGHLLLHEVVQLMGPEIKAVAHRPRHHRLPVETGGGHGGGEIGRAHV